MFNFKSWSENKDESTCSLLSDSVLYVVYYHSDELCTEINAYVVHPIDAGLIRRDFLRVGGPFNWGPTGTVMYNGAN